MKVNYDDIINAAGDSCNFSEIGAICRALKYTCNRNGEFLIIECQSKREGWIPSSQVKAVADFFVLDGNLIKDRLGTGKAIEKY